MQGKERQSGRFRSHHRSTTKGAKDVPPNPLRSSQIQAVPTVRTRNPGWCTPSCSSDDSECLQSGSIDLRLSFERNSMTSAVYQHNFVDVKDYLHHRAPYLMVGTIESIGDRDILTRTQVTGEESFLAGHFPGAPIVPGAMLQEMTTQSAGILLVQHARSVLQRVRSGCSCPNQGGPFSRLCAARKSASDACGTFGPAGRNF